jgi:putative tryptophan/tyrosine transport system substrate-binding protein
MRTWIVRLGLALAVILFSGPAVADAQIPGKTARVGFLGGASPRSAAHVVAFEEKLREFGWIEGQTLIFEYRSALGQPERFPALAAELASLKLDVIVVLTTETQLRAVRGAAASTPIVMIAVDFDPVAAGYVAGLPRPGGTITGLFLRQGELAAKRLEILKELVPGGGVAILWDRHSVDQMRAPAAAAPSLGLRVTSIELKGAVYDYETAFKTAVRDGNRGTLVSTSPVFFQDRARIGELAIKHRLPTMLALRQFVEAGGLMSYGVSFSDMSKRAAVYVDNILRGAKPGDLPVEQPTRFELVINLKTAKALGLTIPQSILLRADDVMQ